MQYVVVILFNVCAWLIALQVGIVDFTQDVIAFLIPLLFVANARFRLNGFIAQNQSMIF